MSRVSDDKRRQSIEFKAIEKRIDINIYTQCAAQCESEKMFGNSSSVDTNEIIKSFDSNSDKVINNNEVAFSKKAQNQCDADENLFLRFLELDPPVTNDTQKANTKGRTPFTISKKLVKNPESSYGFSIVWTHPPRVEKIEPNSSAEKIGMLPGDYIIFIDKYNVVTMPGMLLIICYLDAFFLFSLYST